MHIMPRSSEDFTLSVTVVGTGGMFTSNNGVYINHTLAVRECFKGDEASQWKRPKFDPSPHQNPVTDLHKNWQA